ncbi:MAG: heme lyase CcmF/NrfE family subunit [Coriobacteriia bacterium]|nr:heme lyase CcmF/NrfE family subunit [Coriobacteriia bacterium]
MARFGVMCLGLALVAAMFSIIALLIGHKLGEKRGEDATNAGYLATLVAGGALTVALLVLAVAFFRQDFTLQYVAENHSPDTSSLAWFYKISAVWAGREGSFLLWTWILSLFAAWVAYRRLEFTDRLSNMGLMVTNVVLGLFTAAMLFSTANNPFNQTASQFLDSSKHLIGEAANWGMNPLLQHWAMILHPPMLFIGYAGLTIPFAFAIAALIVNDSSSRWVDIVGRITVFSWMLLGAGIGLGAVWAYVVLGWGGYWGWDPVENASLLPWLTGVALLHSFTVYRRREGFKRWSVMLAAFTFALVILGTFITRSGVVESVHAFSPDNLSLWLFLLMIIGSLVAAGIGLVMRWTEFGADDDFESMASKDAAYYFNNVIMLVAGILVAYMTVTSALPTWMPLGGISIPASAYDAVARPLGILYLMILAVCPLLSWGLTDKATFWRRIKWPLAGAAVLAAGLLAIFFTTIAPNYARMVALGNDPGLIMAEAGPAWYYKGLAIVGLLTASLLIATTVSLFISGARKRAESRGTGFFSALGSIFVKARSQSGGFLAHLGMGVILVGLIGSAMFVMDSTVTVPAKVGSTFEVGAYQFTYQGSSVATLASGASETQVSLQVAKSGKVLGVVTPGQKVFAATQQQSYDAKVLWQPLEDVFVAYQGGDGQSFDVNVKVNPLIWCVWVGFLMLLAGTAVAAWPRRGAKLAAVPSKKGKASVKASDKAKAKAKAKAAVKPAPKKRPTKRS